MGLFRLSQILTMRCVIFVGCCVVGLLPGCVEQKPTIANVRLADALGMKPFGPTGGYPPGTVVAIEQNGLPIEVLPADWLQKQGKQQTLTEPKRLGVIEYDVKDNFLAQLDGRNAGIEAVSLRAALKDVNSFTMRIEDARTSRVAEGPMAFIQWFNRLDPLNVNDLCLLRDIDTAADGRTLFYIHEVLEITNGVYQTKWNRDLDANAKATFESLMTLSGKLTWASDGMARIEITEGAPVLVAYKATEVRHNSLAIQRGLASGDIRRALAIETAPCGPRQP
jgi:hypothetical protein